MRNQPTEPTVTLLEACRLLEIDYANTRLLLAIAKRTPQGWVVRVADLPDTSPYVK